MLRDAEHHSVSLRRLLPGATFVGGQDIEVHAASCDSRSIEPGQTFVAVRGPKSDGHEFVRDAIRRGATALIVERPNEITSDGATVPQCVVPDSREAFAVVCQALEGNPAAQLSVIGITGTNGKTTTSFLVKRVLEAAGCRTGLIGTIEQFDGYTSIPAALTTPGADVLAKLMRRMVDAGCSHVVMEVSSHALDQRRTAGIAFEAAVFTNLTQDHLDYHRDLDSYRCAKGRLFGELAPQSYAVLNADDPATAIYRTSCPAQVATYGVRGDADFVARDVQLSLSGCRFTIDARGERSEIATRLVGEHNIYNCLAAAAVGHGLGIDWGTIKSGIEAMTAVPGRLQAVECGQPFTVLVDYAHTPDAIRSVLGSLRRITASRIICVFGAGGDRDRTKRPKMAAATEAVADAIVVTSDNPRTESPERIIREILVGFDLHRAIAVEPDRREAISLAIRTAQPGECVLIAGKGHEPYQIVGTKKLPFDDCVVAVECLAGLGYVAAGTKHASGAGTEKRQPFAA